MGSFWPSVYWAGGGVRGWGRECDFYLGGSGASAIANFLFECFFAIFSYHQQNFEMIRYDLEKMRVNYSNMESACDFSPYILLEKQETLGNFLFECFLLLLANTWNSWWVLTISTSFLYDFFSKIMFPQKHHFSKGLGGWGWEVFDLRVLRTVITDFIRRTKQISNDTSILG